MVFTFTYSTATDRTATDLFDIHIYDQCLSSNPTVVRGVDDAIYTVDTSSTAATYTPDFDPDTTTCPYTATIRAKIDGTEDSNYTLVGTNPAGKPDLSFMTQTGTYTLSVTNTDFASFATPVVYSVWFQYAITDPITSNQVGVANTYFLLTL